MSVSKTPLFFVALLVGCSSTPAAQPTTAAEPAPKLVLGDDARAQLAIANDAERSMEDRADAIDRLATVGGDAAAVPLAAMTVQGPVPLQSAAKKAATKIDATGVLVTQLQGAGTEDRARAALLLGYLADPASTNALVAALDDGDASVREAAAGALGTLRAESATSELAARLNDTSPEVRAAVVQSLGAIGSPAARIALERAKEDEKDEFVLLLIDKALN